MMGVPECRERIVTNVLEAVFRASGSPFSAPSIGRLSCVAGFGYRDVRLSMQIWQWTVPISFPKRSLASPSSLSLSLDPGRRCEKREEPPLRRRRRLQAAAV